MSAPVEPEPPLPLRVGCVGASVTFGRGLKNRREECYPAVLERMLAAQSDATRCVVRNFGYSGATATREGNEPYWRTPSFHAATRFRSHVVVVMLGLNDAQFANASSRGSLQRDLADLVEHFSAPIDGRRATVMLSQPPPAFPPHEEIDFDALRDEVRPAIALVAESTGAPLIDFLSPLAELRDEFPDGLHPTARAAVALAEVAQAAVTPVLADWRAATPA